MESARAGRFEVIVVEALDRLSRDQEDLAGIYKRLTFAGIKIVAVHDCVVDQLQVGIRGLLSTLFISDLKHKIRRGMTGVVADGRVPGGKAYGYRPVPGQPGEREIDPSEAAVVRRIFSEFAAGQTPRSIAASLNEDGIPPPRGGRVWNASTINGNAKRQSGILHNPLYRGLITWNRVKMVRDPETGRRISRVNPSEDLKMQEAQHLQIVPDVLWNAAHALRPAASHVSKHGKRRNPKRLLSGLLRCPSCSGGLASCGTWRGQLRVQCSRYKESGSCSNGRRYDLSKIERVVIDALVERLGQTDSARAWLASVQADERDAARQRAKAERALTEARSKVERLQLMVVEGRIDADFFDRQIAPARAELAAC